MNDSFDEFDDPNAWMYYGFDESLLEGVPEREEPGEAPLDSPNWPFLPCRTFDEKGYMIIKPGDPFPNFDEFQLIDGFIALATGPLLSATSTRAVLRLVRDYDEQSSEDLAETDSGTPEGFSQTFDD